MNDNEVVSLKFKNSVTGQKKLEEYEKRLSSIKSLIEKMPSNFQLKDNTKNFSDLGKKIDGAFKVGSIVLFTKQLEKLATKMFGYTKKTSEYVENLNLLKVAYHDLSESQDEITKSGERFVNTLSEMYGLDESGLTRTVGLFKQLSNAMNLSDEVGNKLTETLTQLAIDTSSLYNVSFEKATSVLQSAISGQTKPVRGTFGADITETSLQITLDTYGIDATVRDLSFVEKRLLIVTSLMNQLEEAQGDYGRTVESVSNQMKVFNEQTQRLQKSLGSLFYGILQPILPYLNAILMVLVEIVDFFASLLGFDVEQLSDFGGVADSVIDLEEGLAGSNEEVKKLKQGLRGFDKLNVITTPTNASGSSGVSSSGSINPDVLRAFNEATAEYDEKLKNIQMKATNIRDKIMDWLGFTKVIDEETGDISFKFDHITGGTILGALAVGGTIYSGIKKIIGFKDSFVNLFKKTNKEAEKTSGFITNIKKALGGITISSLGLLGTKDALKNINKEGYTLKNTLEGILGSFASVGGGALAGSVFGPVGTIIGAVAGGMADIVTAYNQGTDFRRWLREDLLNDLNNLAEPARNFQDSINKIEQTLQKDLSNNNFTESLFNELKDLVDENGKIKNGYEARVNFITGQLKDAYGIEAEVINGVIKNYDNYTKKIEDAITSKKVELVLKAKEEEYQEAFNKKTELYYKMLDAEKKKNTLYDIMVEAQNAYREYADTLSNGEKIAQSLIPGSTFNTLAKNMENATTDYKKATEIYEEASNGYNKALEISMDYEDLYTAVLNNNKEEQERILQRIESRYELNGENIIETATQRNKRLIDEETKKLNYYKEIEQEKFNEIVKSLTNINNYINGVSEQQARSWASLAETDKNAFLEAFGKLPQDIQQNIVTQMNGIGYNISNELQKGISKINPSIEIGVKTDTAKNTLTNFGKTLSTFFSNLGQSDVGKAFKNSETGKALSNLGSKLASAFNVKSYATGGLPPVGQIFVANEKGAELVGNIGGQSYVANQNQMLDIVSNEINKKTNGVNKRPQIINIYLDKNTQIASYVLDKLEDMADSNGRPIEIGG